MSPVSCIGPRAWQPVLTHDDDDDDDDDGDGDGEEEEEEEEEEEARRTTSVRAGQTDVLGRHTCPNRGSARGLASPK
eukprot:13737621-Alexandrium_andersonii.AAC.1